MKTNKIFFITTGLVISMFLSYAILLVYITWPISELSINKAGVFGDSFGVLTSLFSGLAFSGLIWTIFLQRNDLKIQQEQLQHQLDEMENSRKEMATQSRIQRAQFYATIAQLRVAAKQAEVEALKVLAESSPPESRAEQIESINEIAKYIEKESKGLQKCRVD